MDQLGKEFAAPADEAGDFSWGAALETWPDDDWAGPGYAQRNEESS